MGVNAYLRISRLRALIEHPQTGDSERAAAQRMLDRVLSKSAARVPLGDRVYGARYYRVGRHAGVASIAEMIRADIALMRSFARIPAPAGGLALQSPIADAPAQIAFSFATPHDWGIIITIDGVPHEWGWVSQDGIKTASPALQALADELAEVMNSYNHDGPDVGTRFFGTVRAGTTTLIW